MENRITFKAIAGCYLGLLTTETMRLLKKKQKKIKMVNMCFI